MTDERSPHAKRVDECLKENRKALYIGRVRGETKQKFIEIAENDFEDDYGMLLDHIFWFWYDNKNLKEIELLHQKVDTLVVWLKDLEAKLGEKKVRRAIDGTVIERKGDLNE